MNFKEMIIHRLGESGMFDNQAQAILEEAMRSDSLISMRSRWSDPIDGYAPGFSNIVFSTVKPIAFEWIKKNAPQAWFLVQFAPGIDGLKGEELEAFIDKFITEQTKDVSVVE